MGIVGIIASAIELVKDIMEKLPNYEQSKKEKYFKLRTKYYEELKKEEHEKNDQLIDDIYDELRLFVDSFREEIKTESFRSKDV